MNSNVTGLDSIFAKILSIHPLVEVIHQANPIKRLDQLCKNKSEKLIFVICDEGHHFDIIDQYSQLNLRGIFSIEEELKEIESQIYKNLLRNKVKTTSNLAELKQKTEQFERKQIILEEKLKSETQSLAVLKANMLARVKSLKKLVSFTIDLSQALSISDVMTILKQDLKTFHRVKPPMMLLVTGDSEKDLFYFQGSQVQMKPISGEWRWTPKLMVNDVQDRQFLANVLKRPISKILAVPILAKNYKILFYFEHELIEANDIDQLIWFINPRIQAISVSLEVLVVEKLLKTSSHFWEKTFDGISEPLAVIDAEYKVLRANPQFKNFAGEFCYETFAGAKSPCRSCPFEKKQLKTAPRQSRINARGSDYILTANRINLPGDKTEAGFIHHYQDQSRIHELQGRLIQAEKMTALGHLAGNIAHELNNPLTGIRSLSQLMLLETEGELHADLEEVEKACSRSQSIIGNLLSFSKNQNYETAPVEVDLVIENTLPLVKSALININYDFNLKCKDKKVLGNFQLMQQVFFNLMINACQAMRDGGTLKIHSYVLQNKLHVDVIDTGHGIAESDLQRIFDPFFTTKSEQKGTGLGLSMVRSIVEEMSAQITVKSELGKGAKMSLIFTLID